MSYDVQQSLGDHDATVEWHGVSEATPGAVVVQIRFRFKDGEVGNKDLYPLASKKSTELSRKALRVLGFDIDSRDLGELEKNHELLKGVTCRLVVQENEYNGKVTNRIAFVNSIPKPASINSIAEATRRLRAAKKGGDDDAL